MNYIWGTGGTTLFDIYSIHHLVWFVAITTVLTVIFREKVWMWAIAIIIMWEVFEQWVCNNVPGFPFAGKEDIINKVFGDTISDFMGFYISILSIKSIRKEKCKKNRTGE